MKPGDWMCPSCDCHNFQSRSSCFRCNAPKDGMGGGPGGPPPGQYGAPPSGGGSMRPGDWICEKPTCNFQNFASRHECMRCGSQRPGAGGGAGGYPPQQQSYGGQGGYGGGGGGYQQQNRPEFRPGDWGCDQCQFHNFQSRAECYKCRAPRSDGLAPGPRTGGGQGGDYYGGGQGGGGGGHGPAMKEGDWMCPSCQSHNFRSRTECFRCRAPMAPGGAHGGHDVYGGGGGGYGAPLAPPGTDHSSGQGYGQSLYSQGHEYGIGTQPPGTEQQYNPEWRG
ncbi:hypothetical protein HKX48_005997 [Thoreauomyces humboldtii]|nr:hypothetical protein HKX48_005997 [Thoreauomyces humboldtii]